MGMNGIGVTAYLEHLELEKVFVSTEVPLASLHSGMRVDCNHKKKERGRHSQEPLSFTQVEMIPFDHGSDFERKVSGLTK